MKANDRLLLIKMAIVHMALCIVEFNIVKTSGQHCKIVC